MLDLEPIRERVRVLNFARASEDIFALIAEVEGLRRDAEDWSDKAKAEYQAVLVQLEELHDELEGERAVLEQVIDIICEPKNGLYDQLAQMSTKVQLLRKALQRLAWAQSYFDNAAEEAGRAPIPAYRLIAREALESTK